MTELATRFSARFEESPTFMGFCCVSMVFNTWVSDLQKPKRHVEIRFLMGVLSRWAAATR